MSSIQEHRVAAQNAGIFASAGTVLRGERPRYVIRRKADGFCWLGFGSVGSLWIGDPILAYHFDGQVAATSMLLFELDESPEQFEIVPVAI